ncbi:uncharacterized protein LOC142217893 [Leptodactylus fuscus]|uniref:uncharacterized protein LOC142217893 n=1 Tax=Leptodactylus fuscus TaxID=238119 RepID=UPI003F4EBF00
MGLEIRIGNSEVRGGRNNPRCARIASIGSGETLLYDCGGMEGRFVTIIIPGRKEYLQLCEVQVFADLLEETKDAMYHNVALNGVASQSSTFSSSGDARNANDGSLANNHIMSQCSITQREPSPWWMVDLQATYKVFAVVITNRVLECCKHRISAAEIRIGNSSEAGGTLNPRCGVITSMESGESLYFACNGMAGQYVTVTIPDEPSTSSYVRFRFSGSGFFWRRDFRCEAIYTQNSPEEVDDSDDDSDDDDDDVIEHLSIPLLGDDLLSISYEFRPYWLRSNLPNLALSGLSSQSSLYNFFGESKNAIDGSLIERLLSEAVQPDAAGD